MCSMHYSRYRKYGTVKRILESIPDEPGEIWKDISGYVGKYQVSSLGRVKSLNFDRSGQPRILKAKNHQGYPRVILWNSGTRREVCIHRLVAEAFIPNPEDKPFVNHKDGDRRNNQLKNLEWVTAKENSIHAVIQLGKNPRTWSMTPILDAETGRVFATQVDAAKFFNTSQGSIGKVARSNCHTIRGHHLILIDKKTYNSLRGSTSNPTEQRLN